MFKRTYRKVKYFYYQAKLIHYLCFKFNLMIDMEDINRLKLVLVEKKKTGKWLAEQLKATLSRIAELLNIDRRELINKSK